MSYKKYTSEAESIDLYQMSLFNAMDNAEIAAELLDVGYSPEKIAEGKQLLNLTISKMDHNRKEDNESSEASKRYHDLHESLIKLYKTDRKKAKVLFRKDPLVLESLAIDSIEARHISKWIEAVKTFYSEALNSEVITNKMALLNVSAEHLNEALNLADELELARSKNQQENAESQEATRLKDEAFSKLDEWMSDFYIIARIALEDRPQLLEALGKVVKS